MTDNAKKIDESQTLAAKLRWLIAGRLFAAILLLLMSALWTQGRFSAAASAGVLRGALPIFLMVVGLSLLYITALRFLGHLSYQAGAQFFADVLLITWPSGDGDVYSPYVALYVMTIAVARSSGAHAAR